MSIRYHTTDTQALNDVDIEILTPNNAITLNSSNLQFPPLIKKDSKSSKWNEQDMFSYEPIKFYMGSQARAISLEFKWVIGGEFTPSAVHETVSKVKSYFYAGYLGSGFEQYPAIAINKFYGLIDVRSTWRMISINIAYSDEMIRLDGRVYPLIITMTMDLESATQIAATNAGGSGNAADAGESPFSNFSNLEASPVESWY